MASLAFDAVWPEMAGKRKPFVNHDSVQAGAVLGCHSSNILAFPSSGNKKVEWKSRNPRPAMFP